MSSKKPGFLLKVAITDSLYNCLMMGFNFSFHCFDSFALNFIVRPEFLFGNNYAVCIHIYTLPFKYDYLFLLPQSRIIIY